MQVKKADTMHIDIVEDLHQKPALFLDTPSLSADSIYPVKLLLAGGVFHADEVNADADKHLWTGLFKNKNGYTWAIPKLHSVETQMLFWMTTDKKPVG